MHVSNPAIAFKVDVGTERMGGKGSKFDGKSGAVGSRIPGLGYFGRNRAPDEAAARGAFGYNPSMLQRLTLVFLLGGALWGAETRFDISFPASAHSGPVTGRVFVMISQTTDREPRLEIGRVGVPFFGRDIEKLAPGQTATIDATDLGTPLESLAEIPAGDYYVQAFVNVYSEFHRADGHTVWMHDDQWEGQRWNRSPGNLYSEPQKMTLDATRAIGITLACDQVIPPIALRRRIRESVKRFRMQSALLTKFWGRPIYFGATVLLPRDYEKTRSRIPALYAQGHFSTAAPLRFARQPRGIFVPSG